MRAIKALSRFSCGAFVALLLLGCEALLLGCETRPVGPLPEDRDELDGGDGNQGELDAGGGARDAADG